MIFCLISRDSFLYKVLIEYCLHAFYTLVSNSLSIYVWIWNLLNNSTFIDKKLLQFMTACQQTPLPIVDWHLVWLSQFYDVRTCTYGMLRTTKNMPKATTCKISLSKNYTRICTYLYFIWLSSFPITLFGLGTCFKRIVLIH